MIKMLQVKYGLEATSMLRNHKHTRIQTSTTRRWFKCSLSKQLIHFLLNNGMMSGSHLNIKLPEIMEQERMWPKLKMVTLNHIKGKPVRCNASPLIKKFEKHTNLKNYRWRWWGGCGPWHIRSTDQHRPLSSWVSVELVVTYHQQSSYHLDEPHSHSSSGGLLAKDGPLDPDTDPGTILFCTV